jgi:murein DD-endopeptidase MepM/ murein hydrolase activator NlpD
LVPINKDFWTNVLSKIGGIFLSCRVFQRTIFSIAGLCLACTAVAETSVPRDKPVAMKKGLGVTETGLKPVYPADSDCSPITSFYASWIDVDGTRRDEIHTGIDAGRLGEWIVAPAPGTVRAVWKADWKWGSEGALLIRHDRQDLNLKGGPKFYYTEFDHLNFDEIKDLKVGQKLQRGQKLARVSRPGDSNSYLPEVHWEVWEADTDNLVWRTNSYNAADWWNDSAELIDPLYMLGMHNPPADGNSVEITPFVDGRDYTGFRGFTYILPCTPK